MTRPSYSELLKDPRWQRKRLEALQLADFKCEECNNATKTLHVHHRIYRKGAKPWEYEDSELLALCEDCHEVEHHVRSELAEAMALMSMAELERLLGYAQGFKVVDGTLADVSPRNFDHAMGICDSVGCRSQAEIESISTLKSIDSNWLWERYEERRDAYPK